MATGDSIPGSIVVARVDDTGNTTIVAGPWNANSLSTKGDTPENKVYVNTMLSSYATKPAGAQSKMAKDAEFRDGEKIKVGIIPSASVSNPVDADSFINAAYVEKNKVRGDVNTKDYGSAMNEVSSDRSLTVGEPTYFFEDTIGSNREVRLAGVFETDPVEA